LFEKSFLIGDFNKLLI